VPSAGRAARRRLWSGWLRARAVTERAVSEFFEDGLLSIAAAISYFGLLALFPVAILLVGSLGLVIDDDEARARVIDVILDNLPLQEDEGRRELGDALKSVTSDVTAFGVVGVAGLAIAASGLMGTVRRGINLAWDSEVRRPPLQGKLIDILLVFGVGLAIALSLALTLLARLAAGLGEELGEIGAAIPRLLLALGQLTPLVVSFITFTFLYRVLPAPPVRLRDVWPGALLAAIGYEAAKTGFAFYLENFARYGAVYGSLGAVIAFLAFVFVAAAVFLLAAELASEWPAVRDAEREELEGDGEPLGRRLRGFLRGLVVSD
jgi:membrane protein